MKIIGDLLLIYSFFLVINFPPNSSIFDSITNSIFYANNLKDDAINLLVQASEEFPSNYLIWQAIYSIESDLSVKKNALIQMRLLDPNNLELLIE